MMFNEMDVLNDVSIYDIHDICNVKHGCIGWNETVAHIQ